MLQDGHIYSIDETIKKLNSNKNGLTREEALQRIERYGKNQLQEKERKSLLVRLFDQLKDMMNIVLIVAAIISALVSVLEQNYIELVDAGIILLIVFLNAIIGLTQENKAYNALKTLKNQNKPYSKVFRNGELLKVRNEDITVGDIVHLEAGDVIPADLRLIESKRLKIEEASLTGESVPSEKDCELTLQENTPLGDRKNMAFSSGVVAYGRGVGIVVAIGMKTEVGKIADMLNEGEVPETPLQIQLAKTAKALTLIVLSVAGVIFIMSLIGGGLSWDQVRHSFMTAVAIAVAAIPEGLPAVVAIVLALSVRRMSERKAIVKNLPSVETLGCCEVICSDKTGTLTLNKMTVKEFFTISKEQFYKESVENNDASVEHLIKGLVLCNDTVEGQDDDLIGDPTETALVAYAKKIGNSIKEIKANYPRIDELPFDSKRKLMSTVHSHDNKKIAYTKGAVDMLLNKCTKILDGNVVRDITNADKAAIRKSNRAMGRNALRVLALGFKDKGLQQENLETELTFVGLVGMIDPPRKEVAGAVATCKKAGMKAVMITGDHLDTAIAIATQIGIYEKGDLAITGVELDNLTDEEFLRDLHKYRVFARVSPENKVRIVKAYKSLNIIVAMTGDGVNDAPSIKIADIGVGMGITGTEVTKGVADMVLSDDNFATIIAAVEEGRKAYSNIQKAVQYLLSANIAEVMSLFIVTFISLFSTNLLFLSAVMILWINLVTDSLPALALGSEKAEKDIMNQPPRKTGSSLLAGRTGKNIIVQGFLQTVLTMASYFIGLYLLTDGVSSVLGQTQAVTMAFATLSLIQLFHAYNSRSSKESLFSSNPLSNNFLNLSFVVGLILTAIPLFIPGVQVFFGTTWLTWLQLLVAVLAAVAIVPLVELQKLIYRKRKEKQLSKK